MFISQFSSEAENIQQKNFYCFAKAFAVQKDLKFSYESITENILQKNKLLLHCRKRVWNIHRKMKQ